MYSALLILRRAIWHETLRVCFSTTVSLRISSQAASQSRGLSNIVSVNASSRFGVRAWVPLRSARDALLRLARRLIEVRSLSSR